MNQDHLPIPEGLGLRPFRAANYLTTPAELAAYVNELLADEPGVLAFALGDLAKAHGMTAMAEATGLARESLYKALRAGAAPRFDTVSKVLDALGLQLVVVPK